jgi:Mrp family chromosome partitioning ATPase
MDCALLVVASGATTKSEVEESERLLTSTNLLGVVLNKAEDYQQPYY